MNKRTVSLEKCFLTLTAIAVLFATSFPLVTAAKADTCSDPYQPCPEDAQVDKTVKNPKTGLWEEDIEIYEYPFMPTQTVEYKIMYRNNGNVDLHNVVIKDRLPQYLDWKSGPGSYDSNTKTLTYNVGDLPKDSGWKEITFEAKIVDEDALPRDSYVCQDNLTWIEVDGEVKDRDTAKMCVKLGEVLPAELPKAGAEKTVALIVLSGAMLSGGLLLRRKASL